jgi:hypothetical protein
MCLLCPSASNDRGPYVRVDAWSGTATFQSGAGIDESLNEFELAGPIKPCSNRLRRRARVGERAQAVDEIAVVKIWPLPRRGVRVFDPKHVTIEFRQDTEGE